LSRKGFRLLVKRVTASPSVSLCPDAFERHRRVLAGSRIRNFLIGAARVASDRGRYGFRLLEVGRVWCPFCSAFLGF
jgi:hypothetical protein